MYGLNSAVKTLKTPRTEETKRAKAMQKQNRVSLKQEKKQIDADEG